MNRDDRTIQFLLTKSDYALKLNNEIFPFGTLIKIKDIDEQTILAQFTLKPHYVFRDNNYIFSLLTYSYVGKVEIEFVDAIPYFSIKDYRFRDLWFLIKEENLINHNFLLVNPNIPLTIQQLINNLSKFGFRCEYSDYYFNKNHAKNRHYLFLPNNSSRSFIRLILHKKEIVKPTKHNYYKYNNLANKGIKLWVPMGYIEYRNHNNPIRKIKVDKLFHALELAEYIKLRLKSNKEVKYGSI